ncbi:hypothetical protein KFE25_010844 [Diacronema lutheri]|uniref:Nucleotide-diphospho-sugar transferase domain-containing protein n=2 Tax=Diacronema lutheri TaxID=2081491 RepID=A0A8J5XH69_DIALT|nr:hypothetical protein KFE25_010844 [Diacronema lutheri]
MGAYVRPAVAVPLTLWFAALSLFLTAQHISPTSDARVRLGDERARPPLDPRHEPPAAAAVATSAVRGAAAARRCEGRFCSVGKLAPYRAGDFERPGELERAVRARSWEGELVLSYANAGGSAWVANLAFSLRDVGIEHFLLLMMSDGACANLFASAAALSCGWSSWDMGGCKSEAESTGATERMWFIRHHYLARIIELGTVNVMALDGDVTVNAMPYALLHEPGRLGDVHAVVSLDNAPSALNVNNGFLYLRRCAPGGQVHRALLEILQRERDVCANASAFFSADGRVAAYWRETDARGITMAEGGRHMPRFVSAKDQKIYQDVLASACCARHIALRYEPSSVRVTKGRWADFVRHFTGGLSVDEMLGCVALTPHPLRPFERGDPDFFEAKHRIARFSHWSKALRLPARPPGGGIVGLDLRGSPARAAADGAGEAAGEVLGAPNTSFIASWHGTTEGEIPGWTGLWAMAPPQVAHFVGGMDKVGAMLSLGWWRHEVEVLLAGLPRAPDGSPVAVGAVDGPTQRHFRDGLPRALALGGAGAAAWHADLAVSVRAQGARRLWLAAVASALGRVAVEPVTDCTQPWIVRLNNSAFGYSRRNQRVPRLGIFQEVDERSRVGATLGECARGFSPPHPHPQGVCCFALFDVRAKARARHGVHGLPGAHHRLVDALLARPGATRADVEWAATGLPVRGEVDAEALVERLGAADARAARAHVLVLRVDEHFGWPLLARLSRGTRESFCADLGERCAQLAPNGARLLPAMPPALAQALVTGRAPAAGALNPASSVAEWAAAHPQAASVSSAH